MAANQKMPAAAAPSRPGADNHGGGHGCVTDEMTPE
jgi:hypothetical protein